MPSLGRALQDFDLGHLRILAELWGLDLPPGRAPEVAPELARRMLEPGLPVETAQTLPALPRQALDLLLAHQGRQTLGELTLRFGPMRPIGPGRREREQPWRDPEAALDGLWYRGLIGLGFFDTPSGPEEFAYIPDELEEVLRPLTPQLPLQLAPCQPPAIVKQGGGAADDAVTLLAALRRRPARTEALPPALIAPLMRHVLHPDSVPLLMALLRGIGVLIPSPWRPDPAAVRELLAAGHAEAEARLLEEWRTTRRHNDLAGTPGLAAPKGEWPNDPAVSRAAVLARLTSWRSSLWYDLESAVEDVRQNHPAYLRPGGNFDSWILQDASSGRLLRGLADWDRVDGALLRQVIFGPLHWLGAVDLGIEEGSGRPTSFRLRFDPASGGEAETAPEPGGRQGYARVFPDGRLIVPRTASLAHRYQVARFAEWSGRETDNFRYRLTPRALAAASSQGLDARRVASVLEAASGRPLPDALRRAIGRWSQRGTEAVLESTVVLRVKNAEILRQLRSDPAIRRYLEEVLGPTAVRIRLRDREALLAAAARRGLLIQPGDE
jgi:hypothetical protein